MLFSKINAIIISESKKKNFKSCYLRRNLINFGLTDTIFELLYFRKSKTSLCNRRNSFTRKKNFALGC